MAPLSHSFSSALPLVPLLAACLLAAGVPAHAALPAAPLATLPASTTHGERDLLPTDYEVIAVYLSVFLRYVTWPDPASAAPSDEPLRIGIVGRDPFGAAIDRTLAGKTIAGHKIEAVRALAADRLPPCQIVFINATTPAELETALRSFAGQPVLTVTYRGGKSATPAGDIAIEFVLSGKNVRYILDTAVLASHGLRPTPGLLETALRQPGPAATSTPAQP